MNESSEALRQYASHIVSVMMSHSIGTPDAVVTDDVHLMVSDIMSSKKLAQLVNEECEQRVQRTISTALNLRGLTSQVLCQDEHDWSS